MKLFICYQSALEYWRKRRKLPASSAHRRCTVELPDAPAEVEHSVFSGLRLPVHIMLGSQDNRRRSVIVKEHVFTNQTPIGSFMSIGNDLMMSSPEFCFLQMANQLTLIELIELGYEFCGGYSLPLPDDEKVPERGFYNRKELTSTKKLAAFLDDMSGVKGSLKAVRALHYLQDGSASPMETKLAMLLTLPFKLGGYGFLAPELNHRINLSKTARRHFRKQYYVCDLFWPGKELAVEYDSDQNHTGSERIANDSNKRNALASAGINVVSVTKRQLYNSPEFESSARTIAHHMGRRLFSKKSNFAAAHRELRRQLL